VWLRVYTYTNARATKMLTHKCELSFHVLMSLL
jgi:hypothetical protein